MAGNTFYIPEMGEDGEQKTTTIEIENPEHHETIPHPETEKQNDGFKSALWAKRTFNGERDMLVCAFLSAVRHEAQTGEKTLDTLVEEIRQEIDNTNRY